MLLYYHRSLLLYVLVVFTLPSIFFSEYIFYFCRLCMVAKKCTSIGLVQREYRSHRKRILHTVKRLRHNNIREALSK